MLLLVDVFATIIITVVTLNKMQVVIPSHYLNITEIIQSGSNKTGLVKRWSNLRKTRVFQSLLMDLAKEEACSPDDLLVVIKGGAGAQGVWGHPKIGKMVEQWANKISDKTFLEKIVKERLSVQLDGETEVITPVGNIDILTSTQIIEVKTISDWKNALGQVLAYGYFYPSHEKRIHLFGTAHSRSIGYIDEICNKYNVVFTWE